MHLTLQEARNGLVRQMLLIGPEKVLQCYTHYLKDVPIFLVFLLSNVAYFDLAESQSGGLKNMVLCSH